MQSTKKLISLTKRQVDTGINKLYKKITNSGVIFTKIVGIERGGLNVSIPLAEKLNIPHCSIKISFYNETGCSKPATEPIVDMKGNKFNKSDVLLIVDDLLDTGSTLKYLSNKLPCDHKFAVLLWNRASMYNIIPDYFAKYKIDSWYIFPWENNT